MIGSLRGRLIRTDGSTALIEAEGVGYEVEMPESSLATLPRDSASEVFVYIHHIVREDAQILYGFTDLASRSLFRILIKVNGVGPKSALAALSTFSVESFIAAVLDNSSRQLQQIPGVGKKTAERMIVELKDTLSKFSQTPTAEIKSNAESRGECFDEAVAALVALGYKENEALRYCKAVQKEADTAEKMIKAALLLISKSKGR